MKMGPDLLIVCPGRCFLIQHYFSSTWHLSGNVPPIPDFYAFYIRPEQATPEILMASGQ